ncbi:MAG TPA: hypothetical protein VGS22_23445 [Thermoanaerobaculia bacterium]|jgi:hypothetical protein|nr:hypothetical protein [Thermoanaerobaculia bacterium]
MGCRNTDISCREKRKIRIRIVGPLLSRAGECRFERAFVPQAGHPAVLAELVQV